jgi:hypothetical protein
MTHSTVATRLGRWKAGLTLTVAAIAATGAAATAQATTYTPNTGPEMQAAVQSANSNPGPDTILLQPKLYQPTVPMAITDDLTIKSPPGQQAPPGVKIDGSFVQPLQSDLFTVSAGKKLTVRNILVTGSTDLSFAVFRINGSLEMYNSTISGNNGMQVAVGFGGNFVGNNSTISDGNDLGMLINGSAELNNVTFTNNNGGVDATQGTLVVRNTILANNDALGFGLPNCFGPVTSTDHSLDSDGTCGVERTANPQLGVTLQQGGPVSVQMPNAGSPVLDTGNNAICPTTDSRMFVRTDGLCDLGAAERGATRDTTAPSCTVTALRNGPPKQQDVTAVDSGSGLDADAISNLTISNGTVAFTPFTQPSRADLVLTATKTDQTQLTRWSFTATDAAGNAKDCR